MKRKTVHEICFDILSKSPTPLSRNKLFEITTKLGAKVKNESSLGSILSKCSLFECVGYTKNTKWKLKN